MVAARVKITRLSGPSDIIINTAKNRDLLGRRMGRQGGSEGIGLKWRNETMEWCLFLHQWPNHHLVCGVPHCVSPITYTAHWDACHQISIYQVASNSIMCCCYQASCRHLLHNSYFFSHFQVLIVDQLNFGFLLPGQSQKILPAVLWNSITLWLFSIKL